MALGGQLQQTIASTAMNLFRRSYLKQTLYTSEVANRVAMKSYFASRVEVFERDVEIFNIFDINSSFPYSMTFPLPGNLIGMGTSLPDEDSDECLYVADVTVEVPDMDVPPLPFRTPDDSRVFFPTGRWRTWFTSTDIRLALREGCKLHKVHEVYEYEPFYDFAVYAKEIYALRSASTTPFRKLLLKYLLNSLYGKAAESMLKQEMLINPTEDRPGEAPDAPAGRLAAREGGARRPPARDSVEHHHGPVEAPPLRLRQDVPGAGTPDDVLRHGQCRNAFNAPDWAEPRPA